MKMKMDERPGRYLQEQARGFALEKATHFRLIEAMFVSTMCGNHRPLQHNQLPGHALHRGHAIGMRPAVASYRSHREMITPIVNVVKFK